MPLLLHRGSILDYTDDGTGPAVVLVHSSVSGNRQWRALVEMLKPSSRVLAVNLHGYSETSAWDGSRDQTLAAQAELVLALCDLVDGPVSVVGHSFGGAVALKAAATLGERLHRLVLLEPIPFYLLRDHGRDAAYREAQELRNYVKELGSTGDWARVAERFADYWVGPGTLAAMPEKRRESFIASIPPNYFEWDALERETTRIEEWASLPAATMVVCARDSPRSVRELFELFTIHCPRWTFTELAEGGHMAPLSRADVVNPIIQRFLAGAPC